MTETEVFSLFMQPLFTNIILPFLLVFTVIYAILAKTEILGKDKKSANVIVALVISFIFITVQGLVGFTLKLIPIVSVLIIVLLCFFLIFGFVGIHTARWAQITLGIVFGIALIIAVLWATGLIAKMGKISSDTLGVILICAILGGAIALVVSTGTKTKP